MNLYEETAELAKIMTAHGLTRIEATEGGRRILLEKIPFGVCPPPRAGEIAQGVPAGGETAAPQNAPAAPDNCIEIKAPIVGVFYAAPSPDALPFVKIGQKIKKGDCLCIIEAMKQMNEIHAEHEGEVIDICIKNGDIAEFGQVMFKLR